MARSGRYSPLKVMITSCARGPDKRGAARRCSGRCSGREGGERWQCFCLVAVEPTTDKGHLEQGQHHDAHEAARRAPALWKGRTACLRPAGSVAARRIDRGGVYERWRAAGTERRMSQSRARGQRWTHGLRGRVEHERVRVRPRGLRRVAAGGTCHTHGAHGEGEEPRSPLEGGTKKCRSTNMKCRSTYIIDRRG